MSLCLKGNRRSRHYATPDFLLRLVASDSFMRLSVPKAAHADVGEPSQEIRVRSGRDNRLRTAAYVSVGGGTESKEKLIELG
jgi:hypothetical protein